MSLATLIDRYGRAIVLAVALAAAAKVTAKTMARPYRSISMARLMTRW